VFEPRRSQGPLGTGVHLLRWSEGRDGVVSAEAWLTFVFLPLVPLGRWTLERAEAGSRSGRVRHIERPGLWSSLAWVAAGLLVAGVSLLPAYCAVTSFLGSKPAEIGGLFTTAAAILGTLGWLDATRDRVSLRDAWRVLRRAGKDVGPSAAPSPAQAKSTIQKTT
jgi:hypothetical protein